MWFVPGVQASRSSVVSGQGGLLQLPNTLSWNWQGLVKNTIAILRWFCLYSCYQTWWRVAVQKFELTHLWGLQVCLTFLSTLTTLNAPQPAGKTWNVWGTNTVIPTPYLSLLFLPLPVVQRYSGNAMHMTAEFVGTYSGRFRKILTTTFSNFEGTVETQHTCQLSLLPRTTTGTRAGAAGTGPSAWSPTRSFNRMKMCCRKDLTNVWYLW